MAARLESDKNVVRRVHTPLILEPLESRRLLSIAHPTLEIETETPDTKNTSQPQSNSAPSASDGEEAAQSAVARAGNTGTQSSQAAAQKTVQSQAVSSQSDSQSQQSNAGASASRQSTATASGTSSGNQESDQNSPSQAASSSSDGAASAQQQAAAPRQTDVAEATTAAAKPLNVETSGGETARSTAAEVFTASSSFIRDLRPAPSPSTFNLAPLISALRTQVIPTHALDIPQLASQAQTEAATAVAQIADQAVSALQAAVQALPPISNMAIPEFMPLNALNNFADAVSEFAHESAALSTAMVNVGNHKLAWAVTFAVLAADGILIGRWRMNRRQKKAVAVEPCRSLFSLRRMRR